MSDQENRTEYGELTLPDSVIKIGEMICGCGRPQDAWEVVHAHLNRRAVRTYESQGFVYDDPRDLLIAYVLDSLRYTEHGGSIGSAWLTEAGEELKGFLDTYGADWGDKERWIDSRGVSWGLFG